MNNLLENLNEEQIKAVTKTEGPLLVLAGAGSGKTTVLVRRIAYIIEKNKVSPYNILAITFTNKAANEMKERIINLLGGLSGGMWIGTFHSICVKILRANIDLLGYSKDFVIYDGSDARTLIKECMRELDLDEKNMPAKSVLAAISGAKNDMLEPDAFCDRYRNDYMLNTVGRIYKLYQAKLRANNALDFDDMILLTVKILSMNPDVLMKYQSRFEYILVDEYQDTNNSQYQLVALLAKGYNNLCVVGDDDQSIYRFRGANVGNILSFKEDYPDAAVIRLEQNYRSTQTMLNAANAVIANNSGRMGKTLWTGNDKGESIVSYTAANEYDEARYIAKEIKRLHEESGRYGDCAVLYRANAQSRIIEEMLMREAVPYRVLAGLRFYDRKEIKDIIAYLRLIHNSDDDLSLKRIINEPKRKIGNVTVEKAQRIANEHHSSLFTVISSARVFEELKSSAPKLEAFAKMIIGFITVKDIIKPSLLVEKVLRESGYMDSLTAENTIENQTRIDNLEEFLGVVTEFERDYETESTLSALLENISLISELDTLDEDEDAALLMTMHSAKGLEFPNVFLTGFEEGLFPGTRSSLDEESLEEERRLCYVAMTRAKKKLYFTKTRSRTIFGKTTPSIASRFYDEVPAECIREYNDLSSFAAKTAASMDVYYRKGFDRGRNRDEKPLNEYAEKFAKGDTVEHRKFGIGKIISVQEFGNDAILQIDFESIGTKQLMAAFAKLKKL